MTNRIPVGMRRTALALGRRAFIGGGFLAALSILTAPSTARAAMTKDQMVQLLKAVDDRQNSSGDWHSHFYMEQKEKDKVDTVYEGLAFRRSADQKFMIMFLKPKAQQGQGYLRLDKNLWFYDPTVGKWERRTERERIAGTNSRRSDFDDSHLAEEYDPEFVGEEKLGDRKSVV